MNRDLYGEVTARIVNALEAGVTPWVRPWTVFFDPYPANAISRRAYRGINVVLLSLEAQLRGFSRNLWLTYGQAKDVGAHVRAGETGCTVVFYKLQEVPHPLSAERIEDTVEPRVIPLLRSFTVFNVSQVANLPARLQEPEATFAWDPDAAAERLLNESGARIQHGGAEAYYSPATDHIQLPEPKHFPHSASYYATALHELVHWTGHPKRLDRALGRRFGEAAYAMEELVAELGSAFLCATCHLTGEVRHAEYVGDWLKVLNQDKRAIFAAAAKAQAAVDFIESECGRPPLAVTANGASHIGNAA